MATLEKGPSGFVLLRLTADLFDLFMGVVYAPMGTPGPFPSTALDYCPNLSYVYDGAIGKDGMASSGADSTGVSMLDLAQRWVFCNEPSYLLPRPYRCVSIAAVLFAHLTAYSEVACIKLAENESALRAIVALMHITDEVYKSVVTSLLFLVACLLSRAHVHTKTSAVVAGLVRCGLMYALNSICKTAKCPNLRRFALALYTQALVF